MSANLFSQVRDLAKRLGSARVLHINSTARGGGVAEILRSELPLMRDLGLQADWKVIDADGPFFDATKKIHNALQGARVAPTAREWRAFDRVNAGIAGEIDDRDWDFVFVHDPQPSGVLSHFDRPRHAKWVWRCHIDSEEPYGPVLRRLRPPLEHFDGFIFSRRAYAFMDGRAAFIRPAIDPLASKNRDITSRGAARIVRRFGLDPDRPIVVQVSRFDPWKDQPGTVAAWKKARTRVPGLQLALIGASAADDPESKSILAQIQRQVHKTRDVFVLADCVDDRSLKAFLVAADVVVQKSLREGFGLTVTEALWSGRPVIGGNAGGIPLQVRDGREGFLVKSPAEAAKRMVELLTRPRLAETMGRNGREHVRRNFLLPRLIRDELRFMLSLRGRRKGRGRRSLRSRRSKRLRGSNLGAGAPFSSSKTH